MNDLGGRILGEVKKANVSVAWYKRKENWWIITGFAVAITAVSLPFIIMAVSNQGFKLENFNNLGVVGDFFGGSTVGLLSLASIIFVTAAIIMQKEELALQREEVKKTREEYEITNNTMKRQQFDNTFFNMVNLHNEIVNSIQIYDIKYVGRVALNRILDEALMSIDSRQRSNLTDQLDNIKTSYKELYNYHDAVLGHYFRNLYRIVKFVHIAELTISDKNNYLGILRAQLSKDELLLLFLNALSEKGEKFKELIIIYDFFDDHLDEDPFYAQHKTLLK